MHKLFLSVSITDADRYSLLCMVIAYKTYGLLVSKLAGLITVMKIWWYL